MNRKVVIESSEGGRTEINYSLLDLREIEGRIRTYEKRYDRSFEKLLAGYSCDNASVQEITDYYDWKNLSKELADRHAAAPPGTPGRKR